MNGAAPRTQTEDAPYVLKRERRDLSEEVQRIDRLAVPELEPHTPCVPRQAATQRWWRSG